MLKHNETDLAEAQAPDQVAYILRNAAQAYRESQGDLQAAWQDPAAGRVWPKIAKRLEKLADELDRITA